MAATLGFVYMVLDLPAHIIHELRDHGGMHPDFETCEACFPMCGRIWESVEPDEMETSWRNRCQRWASEGGSPAPNFSLVLHFLGCHCVKGLCRTSLPQLRFSVMLHDCVWLKTLRNQCTKCCPSHPFPLSGIFFIVTQK